MSLTKPANNLEILPSRKSDKILFKIIKSCKDRIICTSLIFCHQDHIFKEFYQYHTKICTYEIPSKI